MPAARRSVRATAAVLATMALSLAPMPAAAADVSDEAAFRAAWANPAETLVVLRADIALSCEGGQPERTSDTSVVVSGNGFSLTQPCVGHDGLHAVGAGTVTVRNLAVVGGPGTDDGIEAAAAMDVQTSTVTGFGGGGIESAGPISLAGSLVADNGERGVSSPAGVVVVASTVSGNGQQGLWSGDEADTSLTDSTVAGNGLTGVDAGGTVAVTRSTVAGNGHGVGGAGAGPTPGQVGTAGNSAAGGVVGTSVELTNSTVVGNAAVGAQASAALDAVHSTISDHPVNVAGASEAALTLFATALVDGGANCLGAVVDAGFNFVDDGSCGAVPASDADPLLGPLANNGGPTPTRAPGEGSPLVDAVPAESCTAVTGDQRGVFRPQGPACEIGSVELGLLEPPPGPSPGAPTPAPTPSPTPGATTGRLPDTATKMGDGRGVALIVVVVLGAVVTLGRASREASARR